MPSRQNPRVNLTLPPDVLEIVQSYSEVVGKPTSTMIRDLLIEMLPMMRATVEVARKSEQERKEAFNDFQLFALNILGQTLTTITEKPK